MRVIIASTTVPHIDGGGRLIVQWTAEAMRAAGHEVEEFYLPFRRSRDRRSLRWSVFAPLPSQERQTVS